MAIKDVGCIDAIVTDESSRAERLYRHKGVGLAQLCMWYGWGSRIQGGTWARNHRSGRLVHYLPCHGRASIRTERPGTGLWCAATAANVPLKRRLIEPDIVAAVVRL